MAVDAVFPNASVLDAFGLTEHPVALQGSEGRTFLSGTVVLRKEDDEEESSWTAELFNQIHANGFRSARPLRTRNSDWIAPGGWSAWTYLEGYSASKADVPQVVPAIIAFHEAIAGFAYVPTLHQRESAYMHADRGAWLGELNVRDARIAGFLERLSEVRRPLSFLPEQLIHGDLNPSNILIASGSLPAIIDLAPYWRPAGFASAVAAFWFGPYRGDLTAASTWIVGEALRRLGHDEPELARTIAHHYRELREQGQMLLPGAIATIERLREHGRSRTPRRDASASSAGCSR